MSVLFQRVPYSLVQTIPDRIYRKHADPIRKLEFSWTECTSRHKQISFSNPTCSERIFPKWSYLFLKEGRLRKATAVSLSSVPETK